MSAWIVSKRHIDVLVTGVLEKGGYRHRGVFFPVDKDNASEVGQMLWRENFKSINFRYGQKDRAPKYVWETPKLYVKGNGNIKSEVLAKQVACYEYQSSEHNTYYSSKACSVMNGLAFSLLIKVGGYESAEWGV